MYSQVSIPVGRLALLLALLTCPTTSPLNWPLLCRFAGVALTLCVFQKQVQAGVCVGMEVVTDALEQLRGAVLIVYPMGLPPHDPIRMELEDKEDLSGTHVSSNVFPLYVILG